jgi:hypothetical protein
VQDRIEMMTDAFCAVPTDNAPGWNLRKGAKDYRRAKPRGKPFKKGQDPRRYTSKNADFARIAREHGAEAMTTIHEVMEDPNANDRARLEAAKFLIERGFGKGETKHFHQVDAGGSYIEALRQINSKPKFDLIDGELVEIPSD